MQPSERDTAVDVESHDLFLKDLMRLHVWPEVERRQKAGLLPVPFGLKKFQILMWATKERGPKVLLNDEFRILAEATLRRPDAIDPDGSISTEEIERITRIVPVDEPDAAHATFFQLNGAYYFVFDFTYNRSRAEAHLLRAQEFTAAAKSELGAGRSNAAVELLWSGVELAALSILLTHPDPVIMTTKVHRIRRERFESHGRLNFSAQASLLRDLTELRNSARYLEGPEPSKSEVRRHLRRANKLVQYAQARLHPPGISMDATPT